MTETHPDASSGADLADLQQGEALPPLPHKRGEPVFRDSWEAEAYAIGNLLVKEGRLSRADWMERMAAAIRSAQAAGDPDDGDTYYHHWCTALEGLCCEMGWTSPEAHQELVALWARAIAHTPHGVPLALENATSGQDHDHAHSHDHDHDHGHSHGHSHTAGGDPPDNFWTPIHRSRLNPPASTPASSG